MFIEKNIKMFSNPLFAKKRYCGGWGKKSLNAAFFSSFFFQFVFADLLLAA